ELDQTAGGASRVVVGRNGGGVRARPEERGVLRLALVLAHLARGLLRRLAAAVKLDRGLRTRKGPRSALDACVIETEDALQIARRREVQPLRLRLGDDEDRAAGVDGARHARANAASDSRDVD